MKTIKLYYILNFVTDQNFDPIENKFFAANWEPVTTNDKKSLQLLINKDKKRFVNCKIVTI